MPAVSSQEQSCSPNRKEDRMSLAKLKTQVRDAIDIFHVDAAPTREDVIAIRRLLETLYAELNLNVARQVQDLLADSYEDTITILEGQIRVYESPQLSPITGRVRTGINVFCEDAGISSANLSRIFDPNNDREMSVYLFITICQHLGIWPESIAYTATPLHEKVSLRVLLSIPKEAITVTMLRVHSL